MDKATMTHTYAVREARDAETTALVSELLSRGIAVRLTVTGRSMTPTIQSGDTVILKPADRIRTGDISYCLNPSGKAVLHRVVRIKRRADGTQVFYTMGDALNTLEGPFPTSAAIGRVARIDSCLDGRAPLVLTPWNRIAGYMRAYLLRFKLNGAYRKGRTVLALIARVFAA